MIRLRAAALLAAASLAVHAGEAQEAGRAVYNFRCYFCHGYSGDARTLAATFLSPPPTAFVAADRERLNVDAVAATLRRGRPGTAMKSFAGILSPEEISAVSAFVVDEFVMRKAANTHYHIEENGWPKHERYRIAFPFARGEIPLSRSWENLTPEEQAGKRLYLASCVSCHDRGAPAEDEVTWDARPLSYPRNQYSPTATPVDAMASASPYAIHDRVPRRGRLSPSEKRGERLFQANCAFCHGADGTGKNWIGQFLEPHPRNLTDPAFMKATNRARIANAIRNGLAETSMPAWKSVLSESQIADVVAYISRVFHPLREDHGSGQHH